MAAAHAATICCPQCHWSCLHSLQHFDSICCTKATGTYKSHRYALLDTAGHVCADAEDEWQDIPLGLDPRVRDLLGNSVALNTTASVKPCQETGRKPTSRIVLLANLAQSKIHHQLET